MVPKCYYKMKINPKAFAIPILTVAIKILADMIAVRMGIANALGFIITRYKKKF